jgi:hypothetical protein
MKKINADQTISKEKIANYIQNKRDKLLEQWYYKNNWENQNPMNTLRNEVGNDDSLASNKQKIIHQIISILPRDPLRGQHEPLPSYLAWWTKESTINNVFSKINQRIMTEEEYNNIMQQVEKYWSILPDTKIRNRDFGGARWSLILSLSTGKIYDVESDSWRELLKDYKWKQYYSSRSWMSGAWYIYAGKSSLVYLPMMRIDVAHPWSEGWLQEINWLNMAILTNRGAINEEYPTVIKDCVWVDVVLLSQKDHLSPDWSWKLLWEVIKSKWACIEHLPTRTFTTEYYDENLQKQTLSFTYKTNMDPKDIKFNDIGQWFLDIKRWFDVETTGKFIDAQVWLRKYKDKYVRLGTFGLIKEIYEENPIKEDQDKLYIHEIEIWSANRIEHTKIEIPLSTDYTWNINGREITNNLAVKKNKKTKEIPIATFENICANHSINPAYIYENRKDEKEKTTSCDLVYERRVAELHPDFASISNEYMEYEESIPYEIYNIYPRSYREGYMKEKLFEKVYNERRNTNNWSQEEQKNIVMQYLKENLNQKFILNDSYKVGNCEAWTKRFMDAFWLPSSGVSAKELLKHSRLNTMVEENRFRAIVLEKYLQSKRS